MGEQSAAVVADSDLASGSLVGAQQRPTQFATLFQSGTPFQVVSRQDVGGRTVIRMVELPR